jgi:hypothetical protein
MALLADEVLAERRALRLRLLARGAGPMASGDNERGGESGKEDWGAPHHQNASLPQLEKFWPPGVVPLGGGAEVEGWNLFSMPLITTLVVDGFFGAG